MRLTQSAAAQDDTGSRSAQHGLATQASLEQILDFACTRIEATQGAYAGAVTPPEAWRLFAAGSAQIVDVRTTAELQYVGRVPGSQHVEWHGKDPAQVQVFLTRLLDAVDLRQPVLMLCRSAVRSHHAACAASAAGIARVFNILEGFEGQRDHARQRGRIDGWRHHGLPWEQD